MTELLVTAAVSTSGVPVMALQSAWGAELRCWKTEKLNIVNRRQSTVCRGNTSNAYVYTN